MSKPNKIISNRKLVLVIIGFLISVILPSYSAITSNSSIKIIDESFPTKKIVISNENLIEATSDTHISREKLVKILSASKKVVLTFDDGPHPKTTPKILKILQQRNLKAIFFVLGMQAKKYPELVRQIYDEGHLIGNHSVAHKDLTQISENEAMNEIVNASDIIENITGERPRYFRPPYGAIDKKALRIVKQQNMKSILWTVDPKDWQSRNEVLILRRIDKQLGITSGKQKGGMILLHDIYPSTVRALDAVLDRLAGNNYIISTIDQIDNDVKELWVSTQPKLLRDALFLQQFDIKNLNNDILVNELAPIRKRYSFVEMLRAKREGNLLLHFIRSI